MQGFWCGVVLFLLGQYITFGSGQALWFLMAAAFLSFGFFVSRALCSVVAVVLLVLCVPCIVGGIEHDVQQQQWLREHPDSFFAKSPAEKQQWLREHDPALAKSRTHP